MNPDTELPWSWEVPDHARDAWKVASRHNVRIWMITEGLVSRQLTRHAYPGQPSTRTKPPIKPCTCQYTPSQWWLIEGSGVVPSWLWGTGSRFTIDPACPNHGDAAYVLAGQRPNLVTIDELWNDPWLNVMRDPYDLDDDERKD